MARAFAKMGDEFFLVQSIMCPISDIIIIITLCRHYIWTLNILLMNDSPLYFIRIQRWLLFHQYF